MLGKLIKHDLKALYRLMIPLHLLVLLAGLGVRFILNIQLYDKIPNAMFGLLIAGYILIMTIVPFVTVFALCWRFYKNLFTDEGYLTLTLPVTPNQHLLSKLISGIIWMLFDSAALILCIVLPVTIPDILAQSDQILAEMDEVLEMSSVTFFTLMFVIGLVSCVVNTLFYYVCIAIGQLFSKHRLIAAVIMYFAISTVLSTLTSAALLVAGFFPSAGGFPFFSIGSENLNTGYAAAPIIIKSCWFGIICMVIQGIASYAGTLYIMKKKINLE